MANSLNKVMLIGRLGDDPKLSYTQGNTAFARMSIATNDRYKDQNGEWVEKTEWHNVKAWGKLAEVCHQHMHKGQLIYVEGSLQTNQYEDRNKIKRESTEVKAIQIISMEGRSNRDTAEQQAGERAPAFQRKNDPAPSFQVNDPGPDDELPF